MTVHFNRQYDIETTNVFVPWTISCCFGYCVGKKRQRTLLHGWAIL